MAMLFSIDVDFDIIPTSVKEQLLIDIQAIISSPFFDISPLYKQFILDIILQLLSITKTTENKSKKEFIQFSKMVVQAVINKYLNPAVDISARTWNDVCNMLGVYVPRNGMPTYYKKIFLVEVSKKITAYHGFQNTFVNKHALGHLAYYYGDILRPIANQAKDYIIPPFFTDVSFGLDSRRKLLKTEHPVWIRSSVPSRFMACSGHFQMQQMSSKCSSSVCIFLFVNLYLSKMSAGNVTTVLDAT